MKIGILTFHRATNYGALLQMYALYKTLRDLGHDVEIIDYRSEAIEKRRKLFRWHDLISKQGIVNKFRYIASSFVLPYSKIKLNNKLDKFLTANFRFSAIIRHYTEMPEYYDAIFFGSDQIWNPVICEGYDKVYYGQFDKGKTKLITYAASIGFEEYIKGGTNKTFKNYLSSYDSISVRERKLSEILSNEYNIKNCVVCDPSQFLSKKDCEELMQLPTEKGYVLLFDTDETTGAMKFAEDIANQLNTYVLIMKPLRNRLKKCPHKICSEFSVPEFLGYIYNSVCVVTDSFHATSFSIILEKDFYTLKMKHMNSRSEALLGIANIKDRLVDANVPCCFSSVDYTCTKQGLRDHIEFSLDFIKKNMK